MGTPKDTTHSPPKSPRYGVNYQKLREERLKLDGSRCRTCAHDGSDYRLECHHAIPDGHPANGDDRYLRLEHLIILCAQCHEAITDVMRKRRTSYLQTRTLPIAELALSRPVMPPEGITVVNTSMIVDAPLPRIRFSDNQEHPFPSKSEALTPRPTFKKR